MELKKNEFERSLTQLSNSLLVTLPSQFVKKHDLVKGDTVNVKINNDWSLTIVPKAIIKRGEEEITIEAYREVSREVVEKVLSGSEKITILSDKKISEEIRDEIQDFIDALPQAEILEDEPQRIVVHNIGFKNIKNREFLHRLLSIVSDLFENIKNYDKAKIERNFKKLKKFYIILIGDLRTFHNTGFLEYSEEELTQKKASDYRIFSYQLKLIGYILRDFELDESLLGFFDKIEAYFNAIFDAFLKQNKRLAHQLWFQNRDLEQEGRELMERISIEHKYKIKLLLMIIKICRSMTALLYS
jgi:antitoxin component of MazEF toxin-antitoxin module